VVEAVVYYYEPRQERVHARLDCAVLAEQEAVEVRVVGTLPPGVRPCSVCMPRERRT